MTNPEHISDAGLTIIKAFEGIEDGDPSTVLLDAYPDPVGLPTIGWGHLILPHEDFRLGITLTEAETLLLQDVLVAELAIVNVVNVKLNQDQFDALASFTFNIGTNGFGNSTLLRWLNEGRPPADIPMQFTRWNKARGRSLLGLARRRVMESDLFLR